jgi:hypothetical protein
VVILIKIIVKESIGVEYFYYYQIQKNTNHDN